MNPRLRVYVATGVTALLAVWAGRELAMENYFWPVLMLFLAVTAILTRIFALPLDTITLGLVTFGYLVGNRGFAQLMPAPNIPLLPAEAALLFCGCWAFVGSLRETRMLWRVDLLNWCVLAWLVAGTAHIIFDVRVHGFQALRDFATVYYAGFFFLAQRAARQSEEAARYLMQAIVAGCVLLPVLSLLYEIVPEFFQNNFRVHGIPVLLYKGDLALMFTGVSAVILFHWAQGRNRLWAWPYATLLFMMVLARESRATILGGVAVLVLLVAARRWVFPMVQVSAGLCGLVLIAGLAVVGGNDWANERLQTVQAHLSSIVGPLQSAGNVDADLLYKWDNNQFRLVWWKNVAFETWEKQPVFGLGFGHDLADEFARIYYPEAADDFSARSPHNVALTVFGRMGASGLLIWLAFCATLLRCTWRSLRRTDDRAAWGRWLALVIILVAAHLQVILEGPMGAVPFWVLLGLAHGADTARTENKDNATLRPAGENASA